MRKWQLTQVFLPGRSHEQRSLAGYSLWCCKDLDMTEQLSTHPNRRAAAAAAAKSLQSCPTLCDPTDGSPPGSAIPGILQARALEWGCHCLLQCMKVKSESEVAQSRPTLSDPMKCSLPGSSVHGIFQARVLEWGAAAFSITSWQIDGKTMETVRDFIFGGLQNHCRW